MATYVDPLKNQKINGRVRVDWGERCHMFADTLAELHEIAMKLQIPKHRFQDHAVLAHYELHQYSRVSAIRFGAKEVSQPEASVLWGKVEKTTIKCPVCAGRGTQHTGMHAPPCPRCGGQRRVSKEQVEKLENAKTTIERENQMSNSTIFELAEKFSEESSSLRDHERSVRQAQSDVDRCKEVLKDLKKKLSDKVGRNVPEKHIRVGREKTSAVVIRRQGEEQETLVYVIDPERPSYGDRSISNQRKIDE